MKYLAPTLLLLLTACAPSFESIHKQATQQSSEGKKQEALAKYEQYLQSTPEPKLKAIEQAATLAVQLEKYDKAEQYYTQSNFSTDYDADYIFYKYKLYQHKDNLSKQLLALKNFDKKFPQDTRITEVKSALFSLNIEAELWEEAVALWPLLSKDEHQAEAKQAAYLTALLELKKYEEKAVANTLLKKDAKNKIANQYLGMQHYQLAETRYKREMAAYNAKKTTRQYKKLLKQLKLAGKDYNKAASHLKKVLLHGQQNKKVLKKMVNIYTRLNNKGMIKYYKRLLK